jgi:hypothetical protein
MKNRLPLLLLAFGLTLAPTLPRVFADEDQSGKSLYIPGRMVVKTMAATIEAINLETREVTLKGQLGNVFTLVAGPEIKRLNEFRAGDEIVLDYSVSVAADIRKPTAEELANPYQVFQDKTVADGNKLPGIDGYRTIQAVVTVEGLDRQTQTVNVKGPKGNYATIKVKDPAIIEKLRLGETALVVYSEGFALRLERAPSSPVPATK